MKLWHVFAAAGGLAVLVLIGVVALLSLQDRLLYYPQTASDADLTSTGLRAWPSPDKFHGLISDATGPRRGTAIIFHGNAGHVGHRAYYVRELNARGFRVILAEYPGYGPRGGDLGETSLVKDAEDTIRLAFEMYGAPLIVVGESLGAGVAAAAAGRQRDKVAALLMITPWNRLVDVAAYHFPWIPVRWLLRDRYDSEVNLRGFRHPIAVVVAERDGTVPARFGLALYETLSNPKNLTVIRDAGHNDWQGHIGDGWWSKTIEFLLTP